MFVACKIPNGLVIGGAGKQHTLLGPLKVEINNRPGGYAITPGVDDALWAEWLQANAGSDMVQNKVVFAEAEFAVCQARCWARNSVQGFQGKLQGIS